MTAIKTGIKRYWRKVEISLQSAYTSNMAVWLLLVISVDIQMISDSAKYFCKEMKHCLNNKKYRINLTDMLIWATTWKKKKKYNNNN